MGIQTVLMVRERIDARTGMWRPALLSFVDWPNQCPGTTTSSLESPDSPKEIFHRRSSVGLFIGPCLRLFAAFEETIADIIGTGPD